jgi:hypothetical protein
MARFRALRDFKTLYRKDNPAAIIVRNVTKRRDREVSFDAASPGAGLDEPAPEWRHAGCRPKM